MIDESLQYYIAIAFAIRESGRQFEFQFESADAQEIRLRTSYHHSNDQQINKQSQLEPQFKPRKVGEPYDYNIDQNRQKVRQKSSASRRLFLAKVPGTFAKKGPRVAVPSSQSLNCSPLASNRESQMFFDESPRDFRQK